MCLACKLTEANILFEWMSYNHQCVVKMTLSHTNTALKDWHYGKYPGFKMLDHFPLPYSLQIPLEVNEWLVLKEMLG